MGTIVSYNGVVLYNVQTREWDQSIEYDESDTDAVFHTFRMRFEGLLHAEADGTVWTATTSSHGSMPAQYYDVQSRILKPRGELVVLVSDAGGDQTEIFRCLPAAGDPSVATRAAHADRDVDNGPKPKAFRILQVIGARCLRVAFEIQCAKLVCPRGTYRGMPYVLNNRWSVAEDMDENNFLTRTISGRLRLSTAVAATGIDAKWLVVPGLEVGFRRASIDFSVDRTGLECDYRIVDRQVHTAAPWPATKMEAQHSQVTNDGMTMTSEVNVRLEGPPHADKKLLLLRAIQIIDAKLHFTRTKADALEFIVEHGAIVDHIGDQNVIEASLRIRHTGTDANVILANLRKDMGEKLELPDAPGQPRPYDAGKSLAPAIYGYKPQDGQRSPTVTLMLQCYLQQPCVDLHGIAKGRPPTAKSTSDEESRKDYEPQVTEAPHGSLPDGSATDLSDSAKAYMYTFARMATRYLVSQCRVQLPVAYDPNESPEATCRVFRLALGQCRRVIEIDAERAGILPEIVPPADTYTDGDLRGVLLRHWIEAHPPSLAADKVSRLYRLTAYYVYALNRPPRQDEKFRLGVAPQTRYRKTDPEVQFDPAQAYANKDLGP